MFDYYSYIAEIKNEEIVKKKKKTHYYCMKLISLIFPLGTIYMGVKELLLIMGHC